MSLLTPGRDDARLGLEPPEAKLGCAYVKALCPPGVLPDHPASRAANAAIPPGQRRTPRAMLEARYGSVLEAVTLSEEFPPVPVEVGKVVSMRSRG